MKKIIENLLIWTAIVIFIVALYLQINGGIDIANRAKKLSFSDFLNDIDNNSVTQVKIRGNEVRGILSNGSHFYVQIIQFPNLIETLHKHKIKIEVDSGDSFLSFITSLIISWFPIIILILGLGFFTRQMQSGGNKTMGFGKSRAKLIGEEKIKITFQDVAGIDEAKEELAEIVEFLRSPNKFKILGGKIPKGCLLIGPPGTGKTLLAKAIAGEARVTFFHIAGSEFVEMFVGVGASRVRSMFEQGKRSSPCVIFIDEIDAVGRHRGVGLGGGNDEREQTLNQLLVEMDGFEENSGVIIIAATNRPDVLDMALLRPGRFDRRIVISHPDLRGREAILTVHINKITTGPDIDISIIARGTPGFSGADLANLVNEAALTAARHNQKVVTMPNFEYARDKVMMGLERKSLIMKEEERRITAYHEAGHAIVSLNMEASDPIHKATIIPRGMALGLVMRLPKDDRLSLTREKIVADITVAMGGRVAEELIFGYDKITSGAESDIHQATKMATSMVKKWGMSDKVGLLNYIDTESISDNAANLIEKEIKSLVDTAYQRATTILQEKSEDLHVLAKALLEFETLTGEEIQNVLEGTFTRSTYGDDDESHSFIPKSNKGDN